MTDQMRRLRLARVLAWTRARRKDLIAFLATLNYFDPPGDPKVGKNAEDASALGLRAKGPSI